jgi:hypothetical protein
MLHGEAAFDPDHLQRVGTLGELVGKVDHENEVPTLLEILGFLPVNISYNTSRSNPRVQCIKRAYSHNFELTKGSIVLS